MSAAVAALVLLGFLVGPSLTHPIDYLLETDLSYGYYGNDYQPCIGSAYPCNPAPYIGNYYQPCIGSAYPCNPAFPLNNYGNVLAPNTLAAAVVNPVPSAFDPIFYPSTTVGVTKENYARRYPFGGAEVGVRDEVILRPGFPGANFPGTLNPSFGFPPYSRFCSLPIANCFRYSGDYPSLLPTDYTFPL